MEEDLKIIGQGTLHGKDFGSIKLEKKKITGKGSLHGKEFGTMKLNDTQKEVKRKILYDEKLNQICINGKWEIPFVDIDDNVDLILFDNLLEYIIEHKNTLVNEQNFEPASKMRDIEKNIKVIKEQYLNIRKEYKC